MVMISKNFDGFLSSVHPDLLTAFKFISAVLYGSYNSVKTFNIMDIDEFKNIGSIINFTIRCEYSFTDGLRFISVNEQTGECSSPVRSLPELLRSISQQINSEIFVSTNAF